MIHRRHILGLLAATPLLPHDVLATAPMNIDIRESLAAHFTREGTVGTFVARNADAPLITVSDTNRSREGKLPASTFKIANSLIALETGVVQDPDQDVFKWDGVKRAIDSWNQSHTMRTAIAVSAVPVYQEIARRIGTERMQRYLDLFAYGNRNIGGGIDQFWLTGDLRIDPMQQIDFVDRLRRGALPISRRSQDLVRDILPVMNIGDAIIRAKSGLADAQHGAPALGWMVGWAEKGPTQTVFALNMDCHEPRHIAGRMTLSAACLHDIDAI